MYSTNPSRMGMERTQPNEANDTQGGREWTERTL